MEKKILININIHKLKKITRIQGKEKYAQAQFCIGAYYDEMKDDYQKAVNYLLNITKEDSPHYYGCANYYLGRMYYYKINNYNKAEYYFSKISQEECPKEYSMAQFKLGLIQYNKNNYAEMEYFYSNISRKYHPTIYATSQYFLGVFYIETKRDYDKAENYYLNIKKVDNPEIYAKAQFELGFISASIRHNYDRAKEFLLKISKDDSPKYFAQAQCYLGCMIYDFGDNYQDAENYFTNISRKDNPEVYALAQYYLGLINYKIKYNSDKAINYFSKIFREDNSEKYNQAQYFLGSIYQENKHDDDMAIKFFSNVSYEHDSEFYYLAQFEIGNIYLFNKNLPAESCKYFNQIKYCKLGANNYISAQIILELIKQKSCNIFKIKNVKELLINNIEKICQLTQNIKDSLMVTLEKELSSNEKTVTKNPERRVAHYTKPSVLFNLLKGTNPSKFRLNIVDFMNDPSENQVLIQWLNITTNPDSEIKTFLASFSFNHNSLNQFRLYGNEENILGSGVSIAFNQNFFGQNTERSINMENINLINHFSNPISANKDLISSQVNIENNIEENIYPLSIYRCLYFDPKTEYISLAKRNKQSFYLEMYHEKKIQKK